MKKLVGDLKNLENACKPHQEEQNLGDRLKRGIQEKVHEVKAKQKIDEAVVRPEHSKEVKVYQNAAHLKDRYTFKGNKEIPHFAHLSNHTYTQRKYLFSTEKEEICEKWIIILNWVIEKKLYLQI